MIIKNKKTENNKKQNKINFVVIFVLLAFIVAAVFYAVNKIKIIQKNDEIPAGLTRYSFDEVSFNYPSKSIVNRDGSTVKIDNWEIVFFDKPIDLRFSKWFEENFEKSNCLITDLISNDKNISYDMQYVSGDECNDSGIYLVGDKKIGKLLLGNTPNNSYEQVLASLRF